MSALNLKPAHKAVKAYFDELQAVAHLDFYDEGAVSPAFAELLRHCGRQTRLTLVEQFPLAKGGRNLRVDGALVDTFKIPHGYWEAKDTKDDLEKEIQKKFEAGLSQRQHPLSSPPSGHHLPGWPGIFQPGYLPA